MLIRGPPTAHLMLSEESELSDQCLSLYLSFTIFSLVQLVADSQFGLLAKLKDCRFLLS